MTSRQKAFAALLFFVVLSLIFTYPLVLSPARQLRGTSIDALGDPLLNVWTLSWDVRKISRLDFRGFFDANIFYPQPGTLLYSEHLLPQALMALPVVMASGNPVLAYNIVFLLGFILSAWGMYLLARHLTGSDAAGIAAGMIYGFCPFLMSHLYQIQILTAWGIPFAFLCLHRYFEKGRLGSILLFTVFYVLQSLANGYYALYLTLFSGLWIVYWALIKKKYVSARFWAHMAIFGAIAAATTGPFFMAYSKIHRDMAFVREIDFAARLTSFLAAPGINRLYGRITAPFVKPEGELFPGIMAAVLGIIAAFALLKSRRMTFAGVSGPERALILVRRALNLLIVISAVLAVAISLRGGVDLNIFGARVLSAHNLDRLLKFLGVLIVFRLLLGLFSGLRRPNPAYPDERHLLGYSAILVLSVLFTFGANGPYEYLYKYLPGFQAVRVAARFDIFVMFALAVLAAFGLTSVLKKFPGGKRAMVVVVLLLIAIEYASIPVPMTSIPLKNEIPEIYRWLAAAPKPGVLVELPLPRYDAGTASQEAARMYWSIFHRNALLNGYSGWFPPLYTEICRRWEKLPFEQLIKDLQALNVDYVVIHSADLQERKWLKLGQDLGSLLGVRLELLGIFTGDDYLFKMLSDRVEAGRPAPPLSLKKIPREGWTAHASVGDERAGLALDGSALTRWESGPQEPGQFFEIDLGRPMVCRRVSLAFGPSGLDFPRGYALEISADGFHWTEAARADPLVLPIRSFIKPRDLAVDIFLAGREARFIRVTNLGRDWKYYWSIYEADVYQ